MPSRVLNTLNDNLSVVLLLVIFSIHHKPEIYHECRLKRDISSSPVSWVNDGPRIRGKSASAPERDRIEARDRQ